LKARLKLQNGTSKLQGVIEKSLEELKQGSTKWSSLHQELILALLNLINLRFYDTCPAKLSNVAAIIVERLAQEWKGDLLQVSAHHLEDAVVKMGRNLKQVVPDELEHGRAAAVEGVSTIVHSVHSNSEKIVRSVGKVSTLLLFVLSLSPQPLPAFAACVCCLCLLPLVLKL
jgi:hypothetical protein